MQYLVPLRGPAQLMNLSPDNEDFVKQIHGAGGTAMEQFIGDHILEAFQRKSAGDIGLEQLDDGATVELPDGQNLVLTTDSHLVKPLFFPGGDIGRLAVCGTVNDLAVMGAHPLALTSSLVVEEGFPFSRLDRILNSMNVALEEAEVPLVTGDTKVMGQGEIDGIVINTAGLGLAPDPISDAGMSSGDRILVTGSVGDHGMALMQHREGFSFSSELASDMAPLNGLLDEVQQVGGITAMKDPTRGGLANALNEMASKSGHGIIVEESSIPIKEAVKGISDLLGISPLEVANEGLAVIAIRAEKASAALRSLRRHALGENAEIIGRVQDEWPGKVVAETEVGGKRYLESPLGDPIPRIC